MLIRIRTLTNVIVTDANHHPAREIVRTLASVKKASIFRRSKVGFAGSPSKVLAAATGRMTLTSGASSDSAPASPTIFKSRNAGLTAVAGHGVRGGSRLSGMAGPSVRQMRPMATLVRQGARPQVQPLAARPMLPMPTMKGPLVTSLPPLPRHVMHAADARMGGRRP